MKAILIKPTDKKMYSINFKRDRDFYSDDNELIQQLDGKIKVTLFNFLRTQAHNIHSFKIILSC